MKLAPVVLFAYNRPWHTEQVLQALKKNELAEQSHLIVFADGPKPDATAEEREKVEKVRKLVQQENWCGSVEYHFAEKNLGCRNSIIQGITQVLQQHEAVIVLEDDIVTSPFFLKFMNQALQFYAPYKSVFSISGYNLPEDKFKIPYNYKYDVYVSLRLLNWGWATWNDRWFQTQWDKQFIPEFLQQKEKVDAFKRGGDDLPRMLKEEFEGKSDAWDIQFDYQHLKNHAVSIVPCHSYTITIGTDGTGTHVQKGVNYKNDLSLAVETPRFLEDLYEDKRIINAFYNAFCSKKRPLWQKGINFLYRKLGKKPPFVIKKKIYC